jgi:cytochrome bd-type quinol oxidase subunit 2
MMSDEFDTFLKDALAAEERSPDRRFVTRVQTAVAIEEHLREQRRAMVRQLAMQLVAVAAVAAGLVWLGRAESVDRFFGESPWTALCALLSLFALLLVPFSSRTVEQSRAKLHK